jgi:hypothetical protein
MPALAGNGRSARGHLGALRGRLDLAELGLGSELITRDGPFARGTTGTMKFVGQDPLEYRLTKVQPLHEFVDETPVESLVVRVSHLLEPLPSGRLRITHTAEIDGPEAEAQHIGPMITADFPDTMAALAALAEERPS